ncbi:hypothetical protein LCGC14_0403390 [marine sediment metagenome]|uniref:Uncharacterized protein n=1 Tax=marine sediment metagenome TaxID=412755 RepID=A0A0F9VI24_9ZZZZ
MGMSAFYSGYLYVKIGIETVKKFIFILLLILSAVCKADIVVFGDGEKLIFANNSQTITFAASPSMSESVNYILWVADGDPGQTIITDGAGVLSFADVNAVAGTHDILSVTHDDAVGAAATKGDIIFGNATPKWDDLAIGASNEILRVASGLPDWQATTFITDLGTVTTGTWNADVITVTYGGTGASSLTDGGILLGSGTGAITALGVATNGQIPIGDGATDPVLATISEGLAIDITNGAGSITVAFDPTELSGNRTWGDASTDTIVWTWDRATGTDPAMTFGNDLFSLANSLTIATGKNITLGTTQWNSSDEIDGTKIKDADYGDVDVSVGGVWTVSSVQANSVALATDTTGDFVNSITGGTGIDSTGATSGENISHTLSFDSTEVSGNRTWGDASTDTIVWTWNRATGTDPTITFGNNLITLNGGITTTATGTFGNLQVDNININGAVISSDTGAIGFSNENLTTTGTITGGTVSVARLSMNDRTLSGTSSVLFTSPSAFSFNWGGAIGGIDVDSGGFLYVGDANNNFDITLLGTGKLNLVGDMDITSGTLFVNTIDDSGAGMITIPTRLEMSFTETTDGVDSFVELVKTWNKENPAASTQYGIFNQFSTSTADWSGASGAITVYTNYNKLTLNSDDMPDSQNSTWNGVYSLIEERANTHDGGVTEALNAIFGEIDYNPDDSDIDIVNATAGRFIAAGTTENVSTMIGVYASASGGDTNWDIFSATSDSFFTGDIAFGQTDKNERIGSDTATTLDLYATDNVHSHSNFIIDAGVLFLNETTTPTAIANHGAIYTKTDNALYFQDGAGNEHLVHGDSESNLWFHDPVVDTVTISTSNTFVVVDSFDVIGEEDDVGNLVGNTTTDDMTVGVNGAGRYTATFHLSAGSGGAADEFIVVVGQVLATPITITAATTATPIVCTAVAHGIRKGDMVTISDGTGMTAINGDWFLKPVTADTFTLLDLQGNNSVGSGTYDASTATVDIVYHGNILLHRKLAQGQLGTGGGNADLRLEISDKLKLYVANIGGTDDIDFTIVNMEAKRIGD